MSLPETVTQFVRRCDRMVMDVTRRLLESRQWGVCATWIKSYPTYSVLLFVLLLILVLNWDSDQRPSDLETGTEALALEELNQGLDALKEEVSMLADTQEAVSAEHSNQVGQLREDFEEMLESSMKGVIDQVDLLAVKFDSITPKEAFASEPSSGSEVTWIDLELASSRFLADGDEGLKAQYPWLEEGWYAIRGRLDLHRFSGYQLYAIQRDGKGILLSTANALDYWFPELRGHVGEQVILGTKGLDSARVPTTSDRNSLIRQGLSSRGVNVMNVREVLIKGIAPIDGSKLDQDRRDHANQLKNQYESLVRALASE